MAEPWRGGRPGRTGQVRGLASVLAGGLASVLALTLLAAFAVPAGLPRADAPVRVIAVRSLLLLAAGVGPVVGQHRDGHLRT